MYDVSVDTLGNMYNQAKEWLNKYFMVSDVAFLFTPPQIALAAMYDTDKRITDKYLRRKYLSNEEKLDPIKEQENENEKQNGEDKSVVASEEASKDVSKEKTKSSNRQQYETLVTLLRKCVKLAKQSRVADREASKEIDKKCFFALNPKN